MNAIIGYARVNRGLWEADQTIWNAFFGGDFPCFAKTVQEAVNRLGMDEFPAVKAPRAVPGKKSVEDCSMAELLKKHPQQWEELREAVYKAAYDKATCRYRCAATDWQSAHRSDFQIDHKKPRSAGGKTVLDNLQLLRRRENAQKGRKWEES